MTQSIKFQWHSLFFTVFFIFLGILSITSCSTVQTMERGLGQSSPTFTSTSTKRKSLNQKQNSGGQIKPFEQPRNAGTYP